MSREQWGHGYHKGVQDALDGVVKEPYDIADITRDCLLLMWRTNQSKSYDRSLFPVSQFYAFLTLFGLDDNIGTRVYNYVLNNEPYGCYIGGTPRSKPKDDFFVLTDLSYLMEG